MKKMKNTSHLEGYVYEHKLERKISGPNSKTPNTPFINGTLSIATDEDCTNVVTVHFSYVTEVTKSGAANATYKLLESIIDGKIGNVMANGKDGAGMVRIDSALDLNEWYDKENNLISVKRNEGGFLHQINELNIDENQRATFDVDMVITNVKRVEADEEKGTPEKMTIRGVIFNFRNAILPMEFSVLHPGAMDYFESLEATPKNPIFTRVKGMQVSRTVIKKVEETSAWGEVSVKTVKNSSKDFVINWAQQEPYEWDDDSTILAEELNEAMANRNIYLAEVKQRQDEWQASRNNAIKATFGTPTTGTYNF